MDLLIPILFLVALSPTGVWLYAEAAGAVWTRRIAAPLMGLGWCCLTAGGIAASSLSAHFDENIKWSKAFCEYVLAIDDQLEKGRVDHVRKQLEKFRDGTIQQTYEGGAFMKHLREATADMRAEK